jgi:hypothetical protein
MIIVHCLHEGRPLCGGPQGLPIAWPENEVWISKVDWTQEEVLANVQRRGGTLCSACDRVVKQEQE